MQLAKTSLQEISQPSNARTVRDLQLMEDDTGEAHPTELLGGLHAPRLVPGRQNHRDAVGSQLPAHLQSDPFVAAGDHSNPGSDTAEQNHKKATLSLLFAKIKAEARWAMAGAKHMRDLLLLHQTKRWIVNGHNPTNGGIIHLQIRASSNR
uniref:Uncharacterized protein n=1 Tax=Oryza rufipogon TaxID=4529 RepID=A0A0E0PBY0_ORYRU